MSRQPIPERDPIGDDISGFIYHYGDAYLLSIEPQERGGVIAYGKLIIRYGVPFLGKPHLSIVPGLIALDYGDMLTGEEAWEFLINQSNLHPRADVLGFRNDGQDEMIVVKHLDLAEPIHVLAFTNDHATHPIARITSVIAPEGASLSERLEKHLSRYSTLMEWQVDQYGQP